MSESFTMNKLTIRGKKLICAITLILILAASSFAVLVPLVGAQAATGKQDVPMHAYINAFPSPVGVGQTISLFAWMSNFPPTANGAYGDRWYNLTVIETKPDGTTVTLGLPGKVLTLYVRPRWHDFRQPSFQQQQVIIHSNLSSLDNFSQAII